MKKIDAGTLFFIIIGVMFSLIGIGSIKYCIMNASSVTQGNWVASIILTAGGIIFVILGIIIDPPPKE